MDNNLTSNKQVSNSAPSDSVPNNEINLKAFFSVIWKGKWLIIVITTLFVTASVVYAIKQPNIYKSEALLAPAEQEQAGGLAALAGQFGGLASLAGVNLGGSSSNKAQLAIEVLKSRKFTSGFIQKHNILPDLMAAKSWDLANNKVIYDEELFNLATKEWIREVKLPYKPEPSMQEAYKEFKKVISINTDKDSGMVTISVEHMSPSIAQQWVNWLIVDINQVMKKRDVLEANRSTEFLTNQIKQTKVADIRTVLYKLIEEQTKTIMFANVRDEYVFKTIDPPIVSENKFKPKRLIIVSVGGAFGFFISIMILLFRRNFCS